MNFSNESLVDKHIPDFSVKGRFLLKFLYKAHYSSVFCTAKYRGGIRRTEGLKKRSRGNGLDCNLPSPAVSRSITGYYVSHIEETPKKR